MLAVSGSPTMRWRPFCAWLMAMSVVAACMQSSYAQAPPPLAKESVQKTTTAPSTTTSSSSPKEPAAKLSTKEINERKNVAYVLLMGVVMMIVALFAFVLLGGSWIRRIARAPLPPVKRPDELWYLKNPAEPNSDEGANTNNTPSPSEEH